MNFFLQLYCKKLLAHYCPEIFNKTSESFTLRGFEVYLAERQGFEPWVR